MQAWHLQHQERVSLLFDSSGFVPTCSCRKCPFFSCGLTAETDTGPCVGLTNVYVIAGPDGACTVVWKALIFTRATTWNKLWNNNLSVTIKQLAFCTCSWKLVPHPLKGTGKLKSFSPSWIKFLASEISHPTFHEYGKSSFWFLNCLL